MFDGILQAERRLLRKTRGGIRTSVLDSRHLLTRSTAPTLVRYTMLYNHDMH